MKRTTNWYCTKIPMTHLEKLERTFRREALEVLAIAEAAGDSRAEAIEWVSADTQIGKLHDRIMSARARNFMKKQIYNSSECTVFELDGGLIELENKITGETKTYSDSDTFPSGQSVLDWKWQLSRLPFAD
jgi:hypothetical protein